MNDKELLELAAKAATDDGDALRLAVMLNLKVECYGWYCVERKLSQRS